MAPVTKVPDVVVGLTSIWRAAVADLADPVTVFDSIGVNVPPRAVIVGMPWDGKAAYESELSREPGMRTRVREDWTVVSIASVLLPGANAGQMPAARRAVADLLGVLDDAVRANTRPDDGAWQAISLAGTTVWLPVQTQDGFACSVVFTTTGSSLL